MNHPYSFTSSVLLKLLIIDADFLVCFFLQKSPSVSGSLLAEAVLLLDICEPLAAANAHNDDGNDGGDGGG